MRLIFLLILTTFFKSSRNNLEYTLKDNIEEIESPIFSLIGMFADWCPYSSAFKPIFQAAYNNVTTEFKNKVGFFMIDGTKSKNIMSHFNVNKFPTVLLLKNKLFFKEYHGKRDVLSLLEFVKKHTSDKINSLFDVEDVPNEGNRMVIILKKTIINHYYGVFKLFDPQCHIYFVINNSTTYDEKVDAIFYDDQSYVSFNKSFIINDTKLMEDYTNELKDLCNPFVRNINFHNAEEIIDSGKPLMILFINDRLQMDALEEYKVLVRNAMNITQISVNPVYAFATEFNHPLTKIGKTLNDLPMVALDDFSHFYVVEDYKKPGVIEEYLRNLASGYLHMKLHNSDYIIRKINIGPNVISIGGIQIDFGGLPHIDTFDPKDGNNKPQLQQKKVKDNLDHEGHGTNEKHNTDIPHSIGTDSVFVKLAPSSKRYSIHDEL